MGESMDQVIELDLGCVPEAAVSGGVLVQTERSTFLTFNAMRKRPDGRRERAGTALIEFLSCLCTRFGYPNDEALAGHPLHAAGVVEYAIYEVLNPSWSRHLEQQNRVAFPQTGSWNLRHFIIVFHDSTFECLAEDLVLRVLDEPYARVLQRITDRVLSE
jgi:hypothetical protein